MKNSCRCHSCGAENFERVLSLGEMPLANSLVKAEDLQLPEKRYPLNLIFCAECALLQISTAVDKSVLFEEYLYFSSYSDTMLKHSERLSETLIKKYKLHQTSLVVEMASNDGYLLQFFRNRNIPVLGIEPAKNVAKVAIESKQIPTICEFFSRELALRLKEDKKQADIVIGNNVLAHVADLNSFVEGAGILLKDDGVCIFEFPYVRDMVENIEFDTIYHEHHCYFSFSSIVNLFSRNRLSIIDVERIPIHGGSLRVHCSPDKNRISSSNVKALLEQEVALGIDRSDYYTTFSDKVSFLKKEVVGLLSELKGKGRRIAAYGASAKGSTLLNYFGIDNKIIDFVVDRSPYKQGLYTPGTKIPILSPKALIEDRPDYVLLLVWNFADEILQQQAGYRRRGGKFIIPIPNLRIV